MKNLKSTIQSGTPVAIVKYYVGLRNTDKSVTAYERLSKCKDGRVISIDLSDNDLIYFKDNIRKFKVLMNNEDGCVWDFNDFKSTINQTNEQVRKSLKY